MEIPAPAPMTGRDLRIAEKAGGRAGGSGG
jgi:hypothetical protein